MEEIVDMGPPPVDRGVDKPKEGYSVSMANGYLEASEQVNEAAKTLLEMGKKYSMVVRLGRDGRATSITKREKGKKDRKVKKITDEMQNAVKTLKALEGLRHLKAEWTFPKIARSTKRAFSPRLEKGELNNNNLYNPIETSSKSKSYDGKRVDDLVSENQKIRDRLRRIQTELIRKNIEEWNQKEMQNSLKKKEI